MPANPSVAFKKLHKPSQYRGEWAGFDEVLCAPWQRNGDSARFGGQSGRGRLHSRALTRCSSTRTKTTATKFLRLRGPGRGGRLREKTRGRGCLARPRPGPRLPLHSLSLHACRHYTYFLKSVKGQNERKDARSMLSASTVRQEKSNRAKGRDDSSMSAAN